MKTVILSVRGMGSAHCEGIVKSSLDAVMGATKVTPNLAKKLVEVE